MRFCVCSMFCCTFFVSSLILTHLDGEERAVCFTLFVFFMACDCYVALAHGDVGWAVECDCCIS